MNKDSCLSKKGKELENIISLSHAVPRNTTKDGGKTGRKTEKNKPDGFDYHI